MIEEEEAQIVRKIFGLYVNTDYGIEKIAKELNLQGLKKIIRQNGTIDRWTRHLIVRILDNPVYVGKLVYGRRSKEKIRGTKNDYHMVSQDEYIVADGQHEALVDEDTWNRTQEKRERTGRKVYKSIIGHERVHLLSGIIRMP